MPDVTPLVQYGAIGLCFGFLVLLGYIIVKVITFYERSNDKAWAQTQVQMDLNRKILEEVVKQNTAAFIQTCDAMRRLSEALSDRPCLVGDSRTKPSEQG